MSTLPPELLDAVAYGTHHDPHSVLGAHETAQGWVIRVRRPLAREVVAELPDGTTANPGSYRVRSTYDDGVGHSADDAYRFAPSVGELDLHLIAEGRHEELWRVLGAHVRELDGVNGTAFTVWAPDARALRVIGDFNGWDGQGSAMRSMG
ncbi:MAG: 1,4-alpha-glucan branching enzyme, partial [Microbacterium sp.]|nr:1,4-alpha-glucan branching enzyme [Microbacterium sp.]